MAIGDDGHRTDGTEQRATSLAVDGPVIVVSSSQRDVLVCPLGPDGHGRSGSDTSYEAAAPVGRPAVERDVIGRDHTAFELLLSLTPSPLWVA